MTEILTVPKQSVMLDLVTQAQIFAKFLTEAWNYEITANEIEWLAERNKLVNSPFREDPKPSFGFQYTGELSNWSKISEANRVKVPKLRARDFASAGYNINTLFWGDCFDLVIKYLKEQPDYCKSEYSYTGDFRDNKAFAIAVKEVYKVFLCSQSSVDSIMTEQKRIIRIKKSAYTIFKPLVRDWLEGDNVYWSLAKGNVNVIKARKVVQPLLSLAISTNNVKFETIYSYNPGDPGYLYYLGKTFLNNVKVDLFQFYFPYKIGHGKFLMNFKDCIPNITNEYIDMTIRRTFCVLTKSLKDRESIASHNFTLFNEPIGVQTFIKEGGIASHSELQFLLVKYEYILVLMDFDLAGVKTANKLRKYSNRFIPIFFTNGRYGTKKYGAKDFFEFGAKSALTTINNLKNTLEQWLYSTLKSRKDRQ